MDRNNSEGAAPSPRLHEFSVLVHDRALSRLMSEIYDEQDPDRRERLRLQMLHEEDRFGSEQERLDRADRIIDDVRVRIRRQQRLVETLWEAGHDTRMADSVLENFERSYRLFCEYRSVLQAWQDRDRL